MTLSVKDLTVQFGTRTILNQLTFSIPDGCIVGLVAPNGTGKTTLFNAMMRYIPIKKGEIQLDDHTFLDRQSDVLALHQQMTFFPDQADLYENFTGREHIELYAEAWKKDPKKATAIIELLQMEHYADNIVQTYSLGMRQRLCFAMMCAADTPVMLMDEVMNGLDPENVTLVSSVLRTLRAQGKMIMVSSHLLDNLDEYADLVFFLKDGELVYEFDHQKEKQSHIKLRLTEEAQEALKASPGFTTETIHLVNGVSCIPIEDEATIPSLLEQVKPFEPKSVTIGPLGTADHYVRIYPSVVKPQRREVDAILM